ncbi:MAG: HIT-like protein [Candidatus Heimdallarchaeota archaeon LC_3]|nr:MAG: HIT-like protein [Candidatus Heimdallarchaeota archaeon LC_3]
MTNQCIFCQIIDQNADAAILYEDDEVIAFLDIQPVNRGHTLIVPKIHVERIEELDEKVYLSLFLVGRNILKKIKKRLSNVTAFNLLLANGADAGQDVFHAHLHIIPRIPKDGFGFKFGQEYGKLLSIEERKEIVKEIIK